MSLYQVTLYTPDPYERASNVAQTRVVGSLKRARRLAREWLAPHTRYETDYSARVSRYADCLIRRVTQQAIPGQLRTKAWITSGYCETVDPVLHYVPSVGDLGWTP